MKIRPINIHLNELQYQVVLRANRKACEQANRIVALSEMARIALMEYIQVHNLGETTDETIARCTIKESNTVKEKPEIDNILDQIGDKDA